MNNDKFMTIDTEALPSAVAKALANKREADAVARNARSALEDMVKALMAKAKHYDPATEDVLFAYNWGNFAFKVVDKSEVRKPSTTKANKFRL